MSDQTTSSSSERPAHFQAGASGSLSGGLIATALPPAAQVTPAFNATDNLNAIPNQVPTANGKSQATYRNDMFPVMAKSSPLEHGEEQEQQQSQQQGARQA